ncbi:hypothetical protein HMPREF0813_01426 [Streptococcus anginosus F0211]|uniref:Uncharacterized protein n=1 Tax=Streptococcus anginosus F0211 TaxID=706437 RepID=E6J2D6_STRAP|nr:hypothetical protein HMPREF0813_01426 [Streptococcus anginosus F0211]
MIGLFIHCSSSEEHLITLAGVGLRTKNRKLLVLSHSLADKMKE